MNFQSLIKNFSAAFAAQGFAMLLSIISSLFVPKMLGVEEYGYWQLFIFYAGYVGVFHFGLNDGVYLINGGITRSKIDKSSIISQFWFSLGVQLVISAGIVAVALLGPFEPERQTVLIATATFLPIQNAALYLGYVFQAMNETTLFSFSSIIERFTFAAPLVVLLLLKVTDFLPYVISYIFSSACQLAYCAWNARDFFSAGLEPLPQAAREALGSIKVGASLMLANIASTLILGVARFVIDLVWGIETFGQLSLSISCVNFFLAFVSQASMVLFPALRQGDEHTVARFYAVARDLMGLCFPVIYLLYYPFVWLLGMWLPHYATSFVFFAYMIPICLFDAKMNITGTTIFKVFRQERLLLRLNVATAVISAVGSLLGAYVFHSVHVVILSVVAAIMFRSVYAELRITKDLGTKHSLMFVGEIALSAASVFLATTFDAPLAAGLYVAAFVVYLLVFRVELRELVASVTSLAKRRGA